MGIRNTIELTNHQRYVSVILGAALLANTLLAQTTPPPPPAVTAFNIERSLPLTALNSTLTPNIPASVLAGVQSGATEIREQVNFSPQASILTLNYFTVQVGSSLPTPSTTILLPARSPY